MVVHREPEQDHEQEQRDHRVDPGGRAEAEEVLADAVLEDEHEHAVGRGHGEQVEQDRLRRDHERAEGETSMSTNANTSTNAKTSGSFDLISSVASVHWAVSPVTPDSRSRERTDGLGDDLVPQRGERGVRGRVGALPFDRHGDVRDRRVLVDVHRDRLVHAAGRESTLLELLDRRLARPVRSRPAPSTTTLAGSAVPGKASCMRL